MSLAEARRILAAARGIPRLGEGLRGSFVDCVVCGPGSPFASAAPAKRILGPKFADHELLLAPRAERVCEGCVSLLAGRPGDDPPPLRAAMCLAVEGGQAVYLDRDGVARVLRDPPPGRFVLTWSRTRKRHASLRAGVSTRERLLVGGEDGQVEYRPREHGPIMEAVGELARRFSRSAIRSGDYPSGCIAKMGPARWARLESVVGRIRGSATLQMICDVAPRGATDDEGYGDGYGTGYGYGDEGDMYDENDLRAGRLLGLLAVGSRLRADRGLDFWGGTFARRVERVRRLPLATAVSKLMRLIDCSTTSPRTVEAVDVVGRLSAEEVEGVEMAIRDRTALVVALAFLDVKRMRAVNVCRDEKGEDARES